MINNFLIYLFNKVKFVEKLENFEKYRISTTRNIRHVLKNSSKSKTKSKICIKTSYWYTDH